MTLDRGTSTLITHSGEPKNVVESNDVVKDLDEQKPGRPELV